VHYPAAARARVYLAKRRAVSLVFKFSRIAAVSTRVKRSDFYCISQLGSTAGNCAQRNILFYSVFTVSLPSFSPLSYLIFAPFLSLSLFSLSHYLSLSHTHTHTHTHCRETIACVHIVVQLLRYFSQCFYFAFRQIIFSPLPPSAPIFASSRSFARCNLTRKLKQLYRGGENF